MHKHTETAFLCTKKAGFRKQSQVEFLLKNAGLSFSCGTKKTEVSLKTMMSYVIQRMPCEGFYPTIVLAFPCGRARMICIHYVWMRFFFLNGQNNFVFEISDYQILRYSDTHHPKTCQCIHQICSYQLGR